MSTTAIASLREVSKSYGSTQALHPLTASTCTRV